MGRIKIILKYTYIKIKYLKTTLFLLKSKSHLKKYKNKYENKRCFIIGNGPSLRAEDLEKLDGEITFASHGIYYIYDKTLWRPAFYCAQDYKLILERYDDIKKRCKNCDSFFGIFPDFRYPNFSENAFGIKLKLQSFNNENPPKFSNDAIKGFYEGMTVTYFALQLAVYMGFKEIYLLGVDHFYSGDDNDHFSKEDVCTNKPQIDKSTLAYIAAKKYADENNIKIYNATRGGKLEVFERVNFDKIIQVK